MSIKHTITGDKFLHNSLKLISLYTKLVYQQIFIVYCKRIIGTLSREEVSVHVLQLAYMYM